jgi:hypothetical protein
MQRGGELFQNPLSPCALFWSQLSQSDRRSRLFQRLFATTHENHHPVAFSTKRLCLLVLVREISPSIISLLQTLSQPKEEQERCDVRTTGLDSHFPPVLVGSRILRKKSKPNVCLSGVGPSTGFRLIIVWSVGSYALDRECLLRQLYRVLIRDLLQ